MVFDEEEKGRMGGKRKILPALFGFFLIAALAMPVRGEKWTFRLSGGTGWLLGGDYNAYLAAANLSRVTALRAYNLDNRGLEAGMDVVCWISPVWGIGLGADFLRVARPDNQSVSVYKTDSYNYVHDTVARAVPIYLNLHYLINAGHRITCDLRAGLAYVRADWSDHYTYQTKTSNVPTYTYRYADKASAAGLGFQLGTALSWRIMGPLSIVGEILLRWAPINGFTGTKTYSVQGYEGEYMFAGRLYYYEYSYDGNSWFTAFGIEKTIRLAYNSSGMTVRGFKEAVIDFSGASFRFGFAIHL